MLTIILYIIYKRLFCKKGLIFYILFVYILLILLLIQSKINYKFNIIYIFSIINFKLE